MDRLYLVYLDRKQNTLISVSNYRKNKVLPHGIIEKLNKITSDFYTTRQFSRFTDLMEEHEILLSSVLKIPPVKKELFPDFQGQIKSLGAWGGDFILAASEEKRTAVINYFKKKGLATIFDFKALALL